MNREQKFTLIKIIVTLAMSLAIKFLVLPEILLLIPYLIIGYDVLLKAILGFKEENIFNEHFLMSIATIGCLILSYINNDSYLEAVAVMFFYKVGEFFEDYAVDNSKENIEKLMDLRPDYATVGRNGELEKVSPATVPVGTVIVVKAGEKIPLDGIVLNGNSSINTSAITGESLPVDVSENSPVFSGTINLEGTLIIKTTKPFGQDTASKILNIIQNEENSKAKSETFIHKFSKVYTPLVCFFALSICIVPTIFYGDLLKWVYRALTFLVISCPCALVISIPLGFFAGIGNASRNGILVKGSSYIEKLANTKYMLFDKTGTLTKGNFKVIYSSRAEVIKLAALCEKDSSHPIAKSIKEACEEEIDTSIISDIKEISGQGVIGKIGTHMIACGNRKLIPNGPQVDDIGTVIYIAIDGQYFGHLVIADEIKEESESTIKKLTRSGIRKIIMLTGDKENVAKVISEKLGIRKYYSELLPQDKVDVLNEIINNKKVNENVTFVGDGLNDAPVLMKADVGIAMGKLGTDAAIESADVVIMDDAINKVSKAIAISKKCLRIVYQNIYFAIAVKFVCLILGASGIANMWMAVFADVGVMVISVINSLRALKD